MQKLVVMFYLASLMYCFLTKFLQGISSYMITNFLFFLSKVFPTLYWHHIESCTMLFAIPQALALSFCGFLHPLLPSYSVFPLVFSFRSHLPWSLFPFSLFQPILLNHVSFCINMYVATLDTNGHILTCIVCVHTSSSSCWVFAYFTSQYLRSAVT